MFPPSPPVAKHTSARISAYPSEVARCLVETRGPRPATLRQTAMMRERAGAGNAVINTWPQSRVLNTFSLSDSLRLCQPASLHPNHFPTLPHLASTVLPQHTDGIAQQAEWNHPHAQAEDTYTRSRGDTVSYTPRIHARILLKPWQPHPPSVSLQSVCVRQMQSTLLHCRGWCWWPW